MTHRRFLIEKNLQSLGNHIVEKSNPTRDL
jgi:hypothetical protein